MTKIVRFIPIHTGSPELDRVQEALKVFSDSLSSSKLLSDHQVISASLAIGLNKVPHGLGRRTSAVFFSSTSGALTSSQPDNPRPDRTVWINATADCDADILVL